MTRRPVSLRFPHQVAVKSKAATLRLSCLLAAAIALFAIGCSESDGAAGLTPTSEFAAAGTVQPRSGTPTAVATPTLSPTANSSALKRYYIEGPDCATASRAELRITDVSISQGTRVHVVHAEIADTIAEKQQGLMCRDRLAPGTGMIFPYDPPNSGGFWMFNTYVRLDILYVSADGTVNTFTVMEPCPRKPGEDRNSWHGRCASDSADYRPVGPYVAALELPAGWLDSVGLLNSGSTPIRVDWTR